MTADLCHRPQGSGVQGEGGEDRLRAVLVPLPAILAVLGRAIATSVGTSRVLFAMARDGRAPARFAVLSGRARTPRAALLLVFTVGFVASVGVAVWTGSFEAYVWWGTTSTFFALLTYLMVNHSALALFRRRAGTSLGGFVLCGAVPLFGVAVDGFILGKVFLVDLWGQGLRGRCVIFFDQC